jgi:hypothetical protein
MEVKNLGPDKVQMIYANAKDGTQVYMMDNPDKKIFNVSFGNRSHIEYEKNHQGTLTYFNTKGAPIKYNSGNKPGRSTRIDTYPDDGMWDDKTDYCWKDNPGYLYTKKGIKNGEYTTFIRVHGDLGTHQAYAHKICGRDQDALRSLIEFVYPTALKSSPTVNYNYAHFPYVSAKPKIFKNPDKLKEDQWVGVKTIHIVADDKKSSYWEMWVDSDPFTNGGEINNNWVKVAEYKDEGCKEYDHVPLTWACQKDVCRVDGFANVNFALFSDREIDPHSKPNAVVPTNNGPNQSEPERDDSQNDNSIEEVQAAETFIKEHPDIALKILSGLPQLKSEPLPGQK